MFFAALIVVAAFVPLFTMQGVEGAIFGPMARTYAYALIGALFATFTVTPVLASLLLPEQVKESETLIVRALHRLYDPVLRFALRSRWVMIALGVRLPCRSRLSWYRGWAANFCPRSRKATSGFAPPCP